MQIDYKETKTVVNILFKFFNHSIRESPGSSDT